MNRVPVRVLAQYKGLRMESSFFLLHPFLRKCGIRDSSGVFELTVSFLQTFVTRVEWSMHNRDLWLCSPIEFHIRGLIFLSDDAYILSNAVPDLPVSDKRNSGIPLRSCRQRQNSRAVQSLDSSRRLT